MTTQWQSWQVPPAPAPDSDLSDKISWVQDCDISLGVEYLGGILGTMAIADPNTIETLLSTVRQMFEDDAKHFRSPPEARIEIARRNLSRAHPHESLCEYLFNFAGAAWPLVKSDKHFAAWVLDNSDKMEQPTTLLLGGCLIFVINATSGSQAGGSQATSKSHRWWEFWK